MAHEKDRDHPPAPLPPKDHEPLASRPKPDCKRVDHPTAVPREPVDPRTHPNRRVLVARAVARPV